MLIIYGIIIRWEDFKTLNKFPQRYVYGADTAAKEIDLFIKMDSASFTRYDVVRLEPALLKLYIASDPRRLREGTTEDDACIILGKIVTHHFEPFLDIVEVNKAQNTLNLPETFAGRGGPPNLHIV